MEADECIHGMVAANCVFCNGRSKREEAENRRSSRSVTTREQLTSPADLEPYRKRYPADRAATFDAYVEVFFRLDGARAFPGGWSKFSRCANAEPALVAKEAKLVERAEELMRSAGYQVDDSGRARGKGRRWVPNS